MSYARRLQYTDCACANRNLIYFISILLFPNGWKKRCNRLFIYLFILYRFKYRLRIRFLNAQQHAVTNTILVRVTFYGYTHTHIHVREEHASYSARCSLSFITHRLYQSPSYEHVRGSKNNNTTQVCIMARVRVYARMGRVTKNVVKMTPLDYYYVRRRVDGARATIAST